MDPSQVPQRQLQRARGIKIAARAARGVYYALPVAMRVRAKRMVLGLMTSGRKRMSPPPRQCCTAGLPGMVSVVLPVYNGGHWLEDAVRSVVEQSYGRWELIIVDDGSEDETAAVAVRMVQWDPRCRYVSMEHVGLGGALTVGHRLARGEYTTWTSVDNLLGRVSLDRLVMALDRSSGTIMAYSDYRLIDALGRPLTDGEFRAHERDRMDRAIVRVPRSIGGFGLGDNFLGCSFLYRTWAQRAVGDWSDELGVEDYEFWLRLVQLGNVEYVNSDEGLYAYRVHDRSLSARKEELRLRDKVAVVLQRRGRPVVPADGVVRVVATLEDVEDIWAMILNGGGLSYVQAQRPLLAVRRPEYYAALPSDVRADAIIARDVDEGRITKARHRGGEHVWQESFWAGPSVIGVAVARGESAGGLERFASALGSELAKRCRVVWWPALPGADVVLNHNETGPFGAPMIEVVHNCYAWLKPWQCKRFEDRIAGALAIVAVSAEAAAYTVRYFGAQPDKVNVILNGISLDRLGSAWGRDDARRALGIPLDAWVWLHVGSVFPPKGQLAAARAVAGRPDEWLILAGGAMDRAYLRQVVRAGGQRLRYLGHVQEMAMLYAASDAVVQPSVVEGWSLGLGEALYMGRPVVCTRVGGAAELVGNTGAGVLLECVVPPLELSADRFDEVCMEHQDVMVPRLRSGMDVVRARANWTSEVAKARELILSQHTMKVVADRYWRLLQNVV